MSSCLDIKFILYNNPTPSICEYNKLSSKVIQEVNVILRNDDQLPKIDWIAWYRKLVPNQLDVIITGFIDAT